MTTNPTDKIAQYGSAPAMEALPLTEAANKIAALEARVAELTNLLGIASEALLPFKDAWVDAVKWGNPSRLDTCNVTANYTFICCTQAVSLDDFKRAAKAAKALTWGSNYQSNFNDSDKRDSVCHKQKE